MKEFDSTPDGNRSAPPGPTPGPGKGEARPPAVGGSRLWPVVIGVGLALVILINGIFIYIAVRGADPVVPSYITEER